MQAACECPLATRKHILKRFLGLLRKPWLLGVCDFLPFCYLRSWIKKKVGRVQKALRLSICYMASFCCLPSTPLTPTPVSSNLNNGQHWSTFFALSITLMDSNLASRVPIYSCRLNPRLFAKSRHSLSKVGTFKNVRSKWLHLQPTRDLVPKMYENPNRKTVCQFWK